MDFYSECYLVFELEKALPDPKTEIVPDQQSLSFAIETGFYFKTCLSFTSFKLCRFDLRTEFSKNKEKALFWVF